MSVFLYGVALWCFWLIITEVTGPGAVVAGIIVTGTATILFRSSLRGLWVSDGAAVSLRGRWLHRAVQLIRFIPLFLWKILSSGIAIARLALTPGVTFWPGIVKTPASLSGIGATTVLANLITLTPGTLTLDYTPDDDMLYIHWIDVSEYAADDIDSEVTSNMRPWIRKITG
ncbi:MAG: Na+/H+ antiporter subunit E [Alkalispirochaeta sp.]